MDPVSMVCSGCGNSFVVEVPEVFKDKIDVLQFYCGDCEVPE